MGADVTHPHPLDDISPSVAAVVGSMNWPAANKYVSRMRSQTHRQEIIQDLGEMVKELLDDFYQELNELPKRIIFFRDGVSETQFYKVLKEELQAIREACSRFPGYRPPISFAVVQKRHHTRFFPCETDPSSTKNQFFDKNIPTGTVVDTDYLGLLLTREAKPCMHQHRQSKQSHFNKRKQALVEINRDGDRAYPTCTSAILRNLQRTKKKSSRVSSGFTRVDRDQVLPGQLPGGFLLRPGRPKLGSACRASPGFKTMKKCPPS
jgi:eukaryotic translation initiation factor 2C